MAKRRKRLYQNSFQNGADDKQSSIFCTSRGRGRRGPTSLPPARYPRRSVLRAQYAPVPACLPASPKTVYGGPEQELAHKGGVQKVLECLAWGRIWRPLCRRWPGAERWPREVARGGGVQSARLFGISLIFDPILVNCFYLFSMTVLRKCSTSTSKKVANLSDACDACGACNLLGRF